MGGTATIEYSTDLSDRPKWLLAFIAPAALIAIPIGLIAHWAADLSELVGLIVGAVAGPLPIYVLLRWWFDHHLWNKAPLGVRLTGLPDLNGAWEGHVTIDPDEARAEELHILAGGDKLPCFATIEQSWTRISVTFETPFTSSLLTMAAVNNMNSPGRAGFHYEYLVIPRARSELARQNIGQHTGTAHLGWDADRPDVSRLTGLYYNGPAFLRYGELLLTRVDDKTASDWRTELGIT